MPYSVQTKIKLLENSLGLASPLPARLTFVPSVIVSETPGLRRTTLAAFVSVTGLSQFPGYGGYSKLLCI